jgi:hypothetical protein
MKDLGTDIHLRIPDRDHSLLGDMADVQYPACPAGDPDDNYYPTVAALAYYDHICEVINNNPTSIR